MHFSIQARFRPSLFRILSMFILLGMSLMGSPQVLGQQTTSITPDIEEGTKPYGAFHGGDIDQVSLSSGKLEVNIPLLSYPQRGGKLKLAFWLRWQNPIAVARVNCPGGGGCTYDSFFANNSAPDLAFTNTLFWGGGDKGAAPNMHGDYAELTAPDGSTKQMVWTGTAFETIDGSGMLTTKGPSIIEDQDGVRFSGGGPLHTVEDANGNYISPVGSLEPTGYLDTLGRTIPLPPCNVADIPPTPYGSCYPANSTTDYSHCSGSVQATAAYTWTVPTPGGGTETFKFCYAPFLTSYVISVDSHNVGGPGNTMLESIVLPNNTTWTFQYGPTYPTLSQITLPTGGTISYTWNLFIAPCSYKTHENPRNGNITDTQGWFFVLASRSVNANDGSGSHTWTYSGGPFADSTTGGTVKITDPMLNDSVHVMTGLGGTGAVYETQTQSFQGSSSTGTLLKTVTTDYNWSPNPFYQPNVPVSCTTVVNVFPIRVTTAWANGQTTKQETDYDTSLKYGAYSGDNATLTGSYGKPIARREYDYASGAPGPLLRQTKPTYMAFNGPNAPSYLANHLLSLPYTVQVLNGSGTQVALTTYGYDQTSLTSSGITTQHDSAPPTGTYRGNRTSVSRWVNTTGTNLTSTGTFYDTGMTYQSFDPLSHSTTFAYSSTFAGAYPTTVTNALSQATNFNYDLNTGIQTSTTDPNLLQTSFSYDNMWRLSQVNRPDGGQDVITHQEVTAPFTATLTTKINSSQNYVQQNTFDGVGRVAQTAITSDPEGTDFFVTTYDALGRPQQTYNPTRCNSPTTNCGESTWGYTTTVYDALNRVLSVTPQDGSAPTTISYSGNTTTVTDSAGKKRQSVTDGLGRLTKVFEDPSGLNYETDYGYDALDDLLCVAQKGTNTGTFSGCASIPASWRPRSFAYDSLSRLTSAANPESGTITYSYDANSNVQTKKDARNITTTYTYDTLNRLTQKSYSDGTTPTASYAYDQAAPWGWNLSNYIGRLTTEQTSNSSGSLTANLNNYDPMGRVILNEQCQPQNCAQDPSLYTSYSYNLNGGLTSLLTGQGSAFSVTYSYSYDAAARVTGMTSSLVDSQHPANLFTVDPTSGYFPNGSMRKATYGNGLMESSVLNNRLQPCRYNVNWSSTALSTCTTAIPSNNLQDFNYGFNAGTTDNGNVASMAAAGAQAFNRTYTYESLNRLSTMSSPSDPNGCNGLSWSYDPWGNRTAQTTTSGSCFQQPLTTFSTSNQFPTTYQYDAAGNMTYDGAHTYTYDAENRLTQVDGGSTASYLYDAEGHRVTKTTSAGWLNYLNDISGKVVAETVAGGWSVGYAYLGGQQVAQYWNRTTYFVHHDHLGSTRLVSIYPAPSNPTSPSQWLSENLDYLPYGELNSTDSGVDTHKFTGKERDSESGLDNFGARYNSSNLGRFMSPDPWNAGAVLGSPQSWNAYSYVVNSPLNATDPNGLDCVYTANAAGNPDPHKDGTTTTIIGDCRNDGGKDDGGVFVDNDQNHPVQNSDVSLSNDGSVGVVSYTRTDGLTTGYKCVGNCPPDPDTVQVNATMSADPYPTSAVGRSLMTVPFDFWNQTPQQHAAVKACMATGGEYGGETLEPPDVGQAVAQVHTANGKPEQYKGNNKPKIPNIKGAKRTPSVTGPLGFLEFLADGMNCVQNVANQHP